MAFANTNISDLIATGIESRTGEIADNVLNSNPITAALKAKGRVKTFSGGHKIIEELSFTENPNGGAYSGYDILPVAPADVISASEWTIKQYAVPVVVSGLEQLQNSGKEALLDLVDSRLEVAESTMANHIENGVLGDGTGYNGKAITGLQAMFGAANFGSQTGTVGAINKASWTTFWQNQYTAPSTNTELEVRAAMTAMIAACTRGSDTPDVIVLGTTVWSNLLASMQILQQFIRADRAELGFQGVKAFGADVYLGGGVGSNMNVLHGFFLNTKYLRFRPHAQRNMVPISPTRRWAVNQDAEVQILGWAGNLTCRGLKFQGFMVASD